MAARTTSDGHIGDWWIALASTAVQNAYCAVGDGSSRELGLPFGKRIVPRKVYERATKQAEEIFGFPLPPGRAVREQMQRQVYCSFRSPSFPTRIRVRLCRLR
jgi:hypothetical protein